MKTFSTAIAGIVLACGMVLSGCASDSRAAAFNTLASPQAGSIQPFQIIDYQTKAGGGDIPEWVSRYLAEGVQGVEKMPEFQDKYVFVGLSEGPNFRALSQWEAAFTPAQDFARLAATRIEARFGAPAQTAIPDDPYGLFFEALVKNASDAQYPAAVKESGFWLRQQLLPADETGGEGEGGAEPGAIEANREVFAFLILLSIDKPQLEAQINAIFDAVKTDMVPKRKQAAAMDRLRETFFRGF